MSYVSPLNLFGRMAPLGFGIFVRVGDMCCCALLRSHPCRSSLGGRGAGFGVAVGVGVNGDYGVRGSSRRMSRLSKRSSAHWRQEGHSSGGGSEAGMMGGSLGTSGL